MRSDYRVVLDACVLIPMLLADTLLRMAEAPRLYLPHWSQAIMDEVTRKPGALQGASRGVGGALWARQSETLRHGAPLYFAALLNQPFSFSHSSSRSR